MKVTFAMIVFNTDLVLTHVLKSILPYAHKIIIVEGPVKYWQSKGFTQSTDGTIEILNYYHGWETEIYPLPVTAIHGQYNEKTEMCQAFMPHVPEDTDYLWCVDADEVFKPETIEHVIKILKSQRPASVGFKSHTFYGGFDRVMGGFEARHNFKRVLKYEPGCSYLDHRPPTLSSETGQHIKHVDGMYHYSYVSPRQVKEKIAYYESEIIKKGDCKENYFENVFMKWQKQPDLTELHNNGVHEFKSVHSYTEPFTGEHPQVIQDSMEELKEKIKQQYESYL